MSQDNHLGPGSGYSVDILTLSERFKLSEPDVAINSMIMATMMAEIHVVRPYCSGSSLIHQARNRSLAKIRSDATHVLFLDSDMIPEPELLIKLLRHEKPVVSALTTTRVPPPKLVMKKWDDFHGWVPHTPYSFNSLDSGPYMPGLGCVLVSTETFTRLEDYWTTGQSWVDSNSALFAATHTNEKYIRTVQAEIAKQRQAHLDSGGIPDLFGFAHLMNGTGSGIQLYEDTYFFWCLHRCGIPVHIDLEAAIGHVGDMVYHADMVRREEGNRIQKAISIPTLVS